MNFRNFALWAIILLLLVALFRFTALGRRMRAVVESPRMTELAGVNADRVSAFSWALSSTFAGLAGVLLAPRFANLDQTFFFELVVVAIAAAALGKLVSLPRALLGGLLLGMLAIQLQTFLPTEGSWSILKANLGPALPFIVLFGSGYLGLGLRGLDDVGRLPSAPAKPEGVVAEEAEHRHPEQT